jgi:hypothetical protein
LIHFVIVSICFYMAMSPQILTCATSVTKNISSPAQITLVDSPIIGLDVPSDILLFPDMNLLSPGEVAGKVTTKRWARKRDRLAQKVTTRI